MPQFTNSPTRAQLRTQLANRLDDYSSVYWLAAELDLYITEALRTWNSLAWFYHDRDTFSTVANQTFYDLTTALTGSMLTPTVTDRNLINAIQYHLLEPANNFSVSSTWAGTEMFTMDDLTQAIQRRRNQLLLETGIIQSTATLAVTANASGRFTLSDLTIDVRRAAWLKTGVYTTLKKTDDMSVNGFSAVSLTTPSASLRTFATILTQPVQIQLFPPTSVNGTLEMLVVKNLANLDPTVGVVLGIPDDLSWIVKWGALADLLNRDGQARDPMRAQYCQQRWEEGLLAAQMLPSITAAYIAGGPTIVGDVYNADGFAAGWQNLTPAQPTNLLMSNWNLVGLKSTPNGVYTVTVDLLRNMIVPTNDSDVVQVGKEVLDVILDYAEHLAAFKMCGEEFTASIPCYQRFMALAMEWNDRLRAQATLFHYLHNRQDTEEKVNRRKVAAD